MLSKTITIQFEEGLHARPASELTKVCQQYKCNISLEKGETIVDPKSILGILTLGAVKGDTIVIKADGEDEKEALNAIETFLSITDM